VPTCPSCAALFGLGSACRPAPDNEEEAENVLVLLIVLLSTTAFRGPEVDWRGLGFLGGLLFLAALPWIDSTRPSRTLALVVVVFALGAGAVGRAYLTIARC
jgi:hypothetical protein